MIMVFGIFICYCAARAYTNLNQKLIDEENMATENIILSESLEDVQVIRDLPESKNLEKKLEKCSLSPMKVLNQVNIQTDQGEPCLNCHLINMGSAISYWDDRCPQCGINVR